MSYTRAFSLTAGKHQRLERGRFGAEVLVARVVDPRLFQQALSYRSSGCWSARVWNLDSRVSLVATPFFRRAPWWPAVVASGVLDPAAINNDVDGKNYNAKASEIVMLRKDSAEGRIHRIGALAAGTWLNGGTIPDGVEASTSTFGLGINLRFGITPAAIFQEESGNYTILDEHGNLATSDIIATYDVVLALELVPNIRLGCDGLTDEIVDGIEAEFDPPVDLNFNPPGVLG